MPVHRKMPDGAGVFALLYTLESSARGLVSSVIPITAYELMQSEQKVSVLYTWVSFAGLAASLMIPMLIEVIARRWVIGSARAGSRSSIHATCS